MPNEIAYYDDENGNRSYFADDTAREQISELNTKIGNFKSPAGVLAINDDAVKQLLIDADAGSITMAIVNPTTSGDSTPFAGQVYLLTSAKYDATRGTQYAIQVIGGTGKKQRLFNSTWGAWS